MFREGIRALYGQFSPGYRRIADYLLNHYQDAAFMTAAEIARIVDVDTALVVRFAQRLGYPGFPELINEVQEEVKRDLRGGLRAAGGRQFAGPGLSPQPHAGPQQPRLTRCFILTQRRSRCVVKVLKEATRIFVAGEGNLSYLCEAFAARLVSLGYCGASGLARAGRAGLHVGHAGDRGRGPVHRHDRHDAGRLR